LAPPDQKIYISDISKIKEQLKWQSKTTTQQDIKELITWAKQN